MKQTSSNKTQARKPGKTEYGGSASVRESTAQSYSTPKSGGKAKAGAYSKYK